MSASPEATKAARAFFVECELCDGEGVRSGKMKGYECDKCSGSGFQADTSYPCDLAKAMDTFAAQVVAAERALLTEAIIMLRELQPQVAHTQYGDYLREWLRKNA